VTDNGWGFDGAPALGEGLRLAQSFAEDAGGCLTLDGADGTAARLELPHQSGGRLRGPIPQAAGTAAA